MDSTYIKSEATSTGLLDSPCSPVVNPVRQRVFRQVEDDSLPLDIGVGVIDCSLVVHSVNELTIGLSEKDGSVLARQCENNLHPCSVSGCDIPSPGLT